VQYRNTGWCKMILDHHLYAQVGASLIQMIGAVCTVRFKDHFPRRRGVIVGISSIVLSSDLQESINLTQFNVEFGRPDDATVVSGAMISDLVLPDETKIA